MEQKRDIEGLEDIKLMVNSFYDQVRDDELIGPIFNGRIQDRWPEHLEKMYKFWQTILFPEQTYFGRPFPPHAKLPVDKMHFDRWKSLFYETVDRHFSGVRANEAKWRAEKMAEIFQIKIDHVRKSGVDPIL